MVLVISHHRCLTNRNPLRRTSHRCHRRRKFAVIDQRSLLTRQQIKLLSEMDQNHIADALRLLVHDDLAQ